MKHRILLGLVSTLASTAAFAGTTPVVETPLLPPPAQTQTASPADQSWALELTIANVFATRNLFGDYTKRFNLAGPELTAVLPLSENSAFTLRGSALYGRHGHAGYDENGAVHPMGKLDLSLMPGYRFTYTVTPSASVYAGVNAGVLFTDVNKSHNYKLNASGSETAYGFAASAEVGVTYSLNKSWYLLAAYQVSGDTARPKMYGVKQDPQVYHGARAGIGYNF